MQAPPTSLGEDTKGDVLSILSDFHRKRGISCESWHDASFRNFWSATFFRVEVVAATIKAREREWNMNRNGSFIIGTIIAIAVAAVAGLVAGTETGREAVKQAYDGVKRLIGGQPPTPLPDSLISDAEIAYATTNLFHLFRDAQYDYIHRHGVMAKSVTELGDGFSIGSFGSLIHEEIWLARFDRPEGDYIPSSKQSRLERDILARPYRYAILPVETCFGNDLDQRTTCVMALPVSSDASPMLVMLGGPIRSDPRDFYRPCQIHNVTDATSRKAFRDATGKSAPVSKVFLDEYLPGWNERSANSSEGGQLTDK